LARRPHPYFGKLDRLAVASLAVPRGRRGRAPLVSPDEEPGVLWERFREDAKPV